MIRYTNQLKQLRKKMNISQEKLADKSGLSLATIKKLEQFPRLSENARNTTFTQIAEKLNVNVNYLMQLGELEFPDLNLHTSSETTIQLQGYNILKIFDIINSSLDQTDDTTSFREAFKLEIADVSQEILMSESLKALRHIGIGSLQTVNILEIKTLSPKHYPKECDYNLACISKPNNEKRENSSNTLNSNLHISAIYGLIYLLSCIQNNVLMKSDLFPDLFNLRYYMGKEELFDVLMDKLDNCATLSHNARCELKERVINDIDAAVENSKGKITKTQIRANEKDNEMVSKLNSMSLLPIKLNELLVEEHEGNGCGTKVYISQYLVL